MGYYTRYELKTVVKGTDVTKDDIWNYIIIQNGKNDAYYGLERGSPGEDCKWYEHEDSMRELSKKFPTVLFMLHGVGEEQGDEWFKYFKNGKMQYCKAVITFEPFDESKLE